MLTLVAQQPVEVQYTLQTSYTVSLLFLISEWEIYTKDKKIKLGLQIDTFYEWNYLL